MSVSDWCCARTRAGQCLLVTTGPWRAVLTTDHTHHQPAQASRGGRERRPEKSTIVRGTDWAHARLRVHRCASKDTLRSDAMLRVQDFGGSNKSSHCESFRNYKTLPYRPHLTHTGAHGSEPGWCFPCSEGPCSRIQGDAEPDCNPTFPMPALCHGVFPQRYLLTKASYYVCGT